MKRTAITLILALGLSGALSQGQSPGGPPDTSRGAAPGGRQGGGGRGRASEMVPGGECPPGMTEVLPNNCGRPELPAPSILDYRPASTLVTAEHKVPKAKFPVVDYHGHPQQLLSTPEGLASLINSLDSLNVRLMMVADAMTGDRLKRAADAINASPYKDRVRVLAGLGLQGVGSPGWSERAVAQLEADVKAG